MRVALILFLAICVSALVVVWLVDGGAGGSVPPPAIAVADPAPATVTAEPAMEPAVEPHAVREPAPAPSEPAKPAPTSWPRARILGRIVDEQQTPAAGVKVLLHSSGPWAPGQDVPVVEFRTWKIEEFSVLTGPDGRFEVDVPVPAADRVMLFTKAPPYLGRAGIDFGEGGRHPHPRVHAGDNDVGDLVLAITGAASGDVLAVDGSPIAKAEVSLQGSFPGGFSVGTTADEVGRFVLGHVPEGTWTIGAKAEGFLSADLTNVEVKKRTTTPGFTFRLERAPTISGRVVDEAGRPLEKMWIWGWPVGSGQGAGAVSKADGSFVIHLPQNEPYKLELEERSNRGRFEPWGGHSGDKTFDPGTSDVLVTLKSAVRTTFLVVDSKDGTPIESYAIGLLDRPRDGSSSQGVSSGLDVQPRPKGECTLAADPKLHRVQIVAPGFEDLETDVAHDEGSIALQTLRLKPGATFVGRVRHAGEPVAEARLVIARDYIKIDPNQPDDPDPWFNDNYTTDVGDFLGRQRRLEGSADGSFRIPDLAAGTYCLTVTGGAGAPKVVRGLRIETGATRDLGEIALDDAGSLHGRIAIGVGQEQMEFSLQVDQEWGASKSPSGTDREFSFENLPVGNHKLFVSISGSGVRDRTEADFVIAAGKTTELVVDLAAKAPCKTRIRVVSSGQPRRGIDVEWQYLVEGRLNGGGTLGTTNEEGVATGNLPGGVQAIFLAKAESGFVVGRSPAPVLISAAASHEGELELRSGELVIDFPASLELPEQGMFTLMLTGSDEDRQVTHWSTPRSRFAMGKNRWKSHHCVIGAVAPGTYQIHVGAQKLEDAARYVNLGEGFASTITIKENETLTVALKP